MPYITTNHRFIIDEKHPSDVFDEMENFFSLYTIEITDLQEVSVQLSVPENFAINDNKKLAESYRQFVQAIRYTIPDANILPIKTRVQSADTADDDEVGINTNDDSTVILLIQRYDGVVLDEEDVGPSLYQRTLGKLLPKFSSDTTDKGLYPAREQVTLTQPASSVSPIPVATSSPPVPQPVPQVQPQAQPPVYVPPVAPLIATPQSTPAPISAPVPPTVQPPPVSPAVAALPIQPSTSTRPAVPRLTNINQSVKPYQDILTEAIVAEAKRQQAVLTSPIIHITLKSSDSLTTAMIEQLFHSFTQAASDKSQVAHDAIDLVSYGYEILKPALAEIGVMLADDAQFAMSSKAHASPDDIRRLTSGNVYSNEINLRVKLASATTTTSRQPPVAAQTTLQTANQSASQPSANHSAQPNISANDLNQNAQRIALLLKISDPLGERQQKVSQFPIHLVSSDSPSQPHHVRLFGKAWQGLYCAIVELDGQVMLDSIAQGVTVLRQGQRLQQGTVLMPHDIITIETAHDTMTVQLLLAM